MCYSCYTCTILLKRIMKELYTIIMHLKLNLNKIYKKVMFGCQYKNMFIIGAEHVSNANPLKVEF